MRSIAEDIPERENRMATATLPVYTKKDFQTDQEIRWCPGCGDYAILSAVQAVLPSWGSRAKSSW